MKGFALGLLISCVVHSASAQSCAVSFSGSVYENAPEDTSAGDIKTAPDAVVGVNVTLSLDATFSKYFKLSGTDILVKSPTELDRSKVGISGANTVNINGEVICNTIPPVTEIRSAVTIQMIYTNKAPPTFTSPTTWEQSEFTPIDSVVATLTATDGDNTGRAVTFSLEPNDYFSVGPNTGELTLIQELDYEDAKQVNVTVIIEDTGVNELGNPLSKTISTILTFDVTDYDDTPPLFQPCDCTSQFYTANITVNTKGNLVDVQPGPIKATDGDTEQNIDVVYDFIGGSPGFENYFQIDPSSGEVRVYEAIPQDGTFVMGIRAEQVNDNNKFSVAYLQVDAYTQDDSKPEISTGGADLTDAYVNDDGSEQLYVEDFTGNRIKLDATDSDGGTLIYMINPPDVFQVLSNGYIFASRSDLFGSTRATIQQNYTVTAINIDANVNSPNRVSDPVKLDITIIEMTTAATTEATTFITTEATTSVPDTTTEETTEPTTLDTTTYVDTTTSVFSTDSSTVIETTFSEPTTLQPTTDDTTISTTVASTTDETTTPEPTNGTSVIEEVVPKSTLIGVAAGLSSALLIAIIIIAYLLWKLLKKDKKDAEDDKRSETSSQTHTNDAYDEESETSPKESNGDLAAATVGFSATDPNTAESGVHMGDDQDSEIIEDTVTDGGYEFAGEPEQEDLVGNEYEQLVNVDDEEDQQTPSTDFERELMDRANDMAVAAAATAALAKAVEEPATPDVPAVFTPNLSPDVVTEKEVIKEDVYHSVKLVMLKGYGDDGYDVKAVLKTIDTEMSTSVDVNRVRKQISIMEELSEMDHPNILRYYGSFVTDDTINYALKYAENGNLKDMLKSGTLSSHDMMLLMANIGKGLQYLHAKNITHGNIWAKAVMLDGTNTPMLTDIEGSSKASSEFKEIMRWQAVEIVNQTSKSSPATDVWSFGTLMWEIVSQGATPYKDVPLTELSKTMENGQLEKPRGCSDSLFSIMEKCWKKDPRLRDDMYVVNSNLSELLLEDSNEHIKMNGGGGFSGNRDETPELPNQSDIESNADFTAF